MASLKKRGSNFIAQYYLGGKQRRISLHTDSLQIAKEKLRQLESSMARDEGLGLPMPVYSHSRLNSFEQCPRKYWYCYVAVVKMEKVRTVAAFLGSRTGKVTFKNLGGSLGDENMDVDFVLRIVCVSDGGALTASKS